MSYIATDEKLVEFGFSFSFDEDDKFEKIDIKKGPDRFRTGYHEVCLEGYNYRSLWDLAESLEEHDYRLVDVEATGLTYYSPDGKTEVYLDEVSNVRDKICRIMILRGKLMEDEFPEADQKVKALFYDL